MIDRMTLAARLQVQWRAAVVAELSTRWIVVLAEGAHPVPEIRGARGVGPGGGRVHAGILMLPQGFRVSVRGRHNGHGRPLVGLQAAVCGSVTTLESRQPAPAAC